VAWRKTAEETLGNGGKPVSGGGEINTAVETQRKTGSEESGGVDLIGVGQGGKNTKNDVVTSKKKNHKHFQRGKWYGNSGRGAGGRETMRRWGKERQFR